MTAARGAADVDLDRVPGWARSAGTYAIPMPRSRHGENVPLVTSPPPSDRVALTGDPGPSIANGTSFSAGPGGPRGGDRLRADEPRVLPAAPAEAGLDRPAILAQVVAVEVEAGLEPQRVAGAESGRGRAGLESASQTPGGALGSSSSSTPSSPV